MVKRQFYQQLSIADVQDAMDNYDDDHYLEFYELLFNQLLNNIRKIPFDHIIQNHLMQYNKDVYKTKETNSLFWLYRADRKFIKSKTVYSFRFANACHPEFYQRFETKAHHLFQSIPQQRHGFDGWYRYIGKELLNDIDKYLNIPRVVRNDYPHKTDLFINQKEERLDIEFTFRTINERITITFERGYPAIVE